MSARTFSGSCDCGAPRFEITTEAIPTVQCHCGLCGRPVKLRLSSCAKTPARAARLVVGAARSAALSRIDTHEVWS